jgi:hypothetical protein
MKSTPIIILLFLVISAFAQQDSQYTHYMYNIYLLTQLMRKRELPASSTSSHPMGWFRWSAYNEIFFINTPR